MGQRNTTHPHIDPLLLVRLLVCSTHVDNKNCTPILSGDSTPSVGHPLTSLSPTLHSHTILLKPLKTFPLKPAKMVTTSPNIPLAIAAVMIIIATSFMKFDAMITAIERKTVDLLPKLAHICFFHQIYTLSHQTSDQKVSYTHTIG
jgi:hypothetical protein